MTDTTTTPAVTLDTIENIIVHAFGAYGLLPAQGTYYMDLNDDGRCHACAVGAACCALLGAPPTFLAYVAHEEGRVHFETTLDLHKTLADVTGIPTAVWTGIDHGFTTYYVTERAEVLPEPETDCQRGVLIGRAIARRMFGG